MSKKICSMCGEPPIDVVTRKELRVLDGPNGIKICEACVEKAHEIFFGDDRAATDSTEIANIVSGIEVPNFKVLPPKEIFNKLKKFVIGQDDMLKDLSLFGYNHVRRLETIGKKILKNKIPKKMNIMLIGPTGTGKTYSISKLAEIINVPFVVGDVTSMTETGYVGADVEDVLKQLLTKCEGVVARAMTGIVALDEIDKLAMKRSSRREVGGESVQHALLKIIEGSELTKVNLSATSHMRFLRSKNDEMEISTEHMGFVGMGAFSGLKGIVDEKTPSVGFRVNNERRNDRNEIAYKIEDNVEFNENLIKYGMIPEFIARFHHKSILKPLGFEQLRRILVEPEDSVIKTETERFAHEGIELNVSDKVLDMLAQKARERHVGARTLIGEFYKIVKDVELEYFGSGEENRIDLIMGSDGEVKAKAKKMVRTSI